MNSLFTFSLLGINRTDGKISPWAKTTKHQATVQSRQSICVCVCGGGFTAVSKQHQMKVSWVGGSLKLIFFYSAAMLQASFVSWVWPFSVVVLNKESHKSLQVSVTCLQVINYWAFGANLGWVLRDGPQFMYTFSSASIASILFNHRCKCLLQYLIFTILF